MNVTLYFVYDLYLSCRNKLRKRELALRMHRQIAGCVGCMSFRRALVLFALVRAKKYKGLALGEE